RTVRATGVGALVVACFFGDLVARGVMNLGSNLGRLVVNLRSGFFHLVHRVGYLGRHFVAHAIGRLAHHFVFTTGMGQGGTDCSTQRKRQSAADQRLVLEVLGDALVEMCCLVTSRTAHGHGAIAG